MDWTLYFYTICLRTHSPRYHIERHIIRTYVCFTTFLSTKSLAAGSPSWSESRHFHNYLRFIALVSGPISQRMQYFMTYFMPKCNEESTLCSHHQGNGGTGSPDSEISSDSKSHKVLKVQVVQPAGGQRTILFKFLCPSYLCQSMAKPKPHPERAKSNSFRSMQEQFWLKLSVT